MSEEDDNQCFRCGAHPKVLITPVVDGKSFHLCIDCYRDFILMLEGCTVNIMEKGVANMLKLQHRKESDADE